MNTSCKHINPLQRQGTSQVQRLLDTLVPENVKLHELGVEDWMSFARNYATLINFYDSTNAKTASGDWENFFVEEDEIGAFLETVNNSDSSPHLSLFIAFLNLLQYPQNNLNEIPKRHLDFYYKNVLRLSPNNFTPDSVHLLFELAKNATSELVAKGSAFEAGKDGEGNILNYNLDKDIVINQAKVAQIKGLFLNDKDENNPLKYALQSNTKDGIEEPLEDELSWSAFGDEDWVGELPVEIALSGEVLLMKEGLRKVSIIWETLDEITIQGTAQVILTGEEGWLDPLDITFGNNNKTWSFEIPEDVDPVGNYLEEIHERKLNTTKPTLIVSFADTANYRKFQKVNITTATIAVDVVGVQNLIVENELGRQTSDKPFMPFGSRPKKNSIMTIDVEEFKNKNIVEYDINLPWLNMPANFSSHYIAYNDEITKQKEEEEENSGYLFGHVSMDYLDHALKAPTEYEFIDLDADITDLQIEPDSRRSEFQILINSPYNASSSTHEMFNEPNISKIADQTYIKGGQIEVQLLSSFYHDLYNPIYISVITADIWNGVEASDLPKEPYTPLTSGLSINYKAESKINFDSGSAPVKDVDLHHTSPFGTELIEDSSTLIQNIIHNTLFIGLTDAKPRNVISLLFQVAEGTEDPDHSSFAPGEELKWSVLTDEDTWLPLDDSYILSNATNNFLSSGIVEVVLPKETGLNHFLLDSGMVWLRVTLNKVPVSVGRFYNIHSQACVATFENSNNTFEHLKTGLSPETITQLARRKSKIKNVTQPYTSFGGKSTESDLDFYRRISERLRHKDRALTIYDYERLVLQDFPQLHKVKCLNHTKKYSTSVDELAPGNVTLVVIPKIKDSGSEYRLKPKVSQNIKDLIKAYLLPKKPMHAELEVANPIYEEVEFKFDVRFHDGYDYNYYSTQIIEDIKAYISPWILEEEVDLTFGASIYKYEVINFLENLTYVDYLEDFIMSHKPYGKDWEVKNEIFPSNSLAVLVAGTNHVINEAINC